MHSGIAAVHCAGVLHADGRLGLAQEEAVDQFYALHQGVVGVADLVLPHAEAAAAVNAVLIEEGDGLGEDGVALDAGGGVAVLGVEEPGVADIVAIFFLQQAGVDQALDGALDDRLLVLGLELAVTGFGQERVVLVLVGGHVRRVVAQVSDAIEGAVALGEVHPALGAGAGLLDADADHVAAAVAEAGGGAFDLARDVAVGHVVAELVEGHGGDEDVVLDDLAVLESDLFLFQVDEIDRLVQLVM